MAPKKITVILDSDHRDSKKRIENQESFLFMLKNHAVVALLDNESVEINHFESLVDGGTYTLGPPIQQQPNGKLRCCFCILVLK